MKVLLVNGSPHKEGCTYTALSEIAKTLNEEGIDSEIFWIGIKPLAGCTACLTCAKTGQCVFDDRVNDFLGHVARDADGFYFRIACSLCCSIRRVDILHGPSILCRHVVRQRVVLPETSGSQVFSQQE